MSLTIKRITIMSMLLILLFMLTACKESIENSNAADSIIIDFLYTDDYWEIYDLSKGPYPSQEEYERAVEKYIDEIVDLLNREEWLDQYSKNYDTMYIKLNVHQDGANGMISVPEEFTVGSIIVELGVNIDKLKNVDGNSPLCHELVHAITFNSEIGKRSISMELNDGLCEFVSYAIGSDIDGTCLKYGELSDVLYKNGDMTTLTEEQKILISEIVETIGTASEYYIYEPMTLQWSYAYILNAYFSKYIIDERGIDYFQKLHDPYIDMNQIAKNENELFELKKEWLQSIEGQLP